MTVINIILKDILLLPHIN